MQRKKNREWISNDKEKQRRKIEAEENVRRDSELA